MLLLLLFPRIGCDLIVTWPRRRFARRGFRRGFVRACLQATASSLVRSSLDRNWFDRCRTVLKRWRIVACNRCILHRGGRSSSPVTPLLRCLLWARQCRRLSPSRDRRRSRCVSWSRLVLASLEIFFLCRWLFDKTPIRLSP